MRTSVTGTPRLRQPLANIEAKLTDPILSEPWSTFSPFHSLGKMAQGPIDIIAVQDFGPGYYWAVLVYDWIGLHEG